LRDAECEADPLSSLELNVIVAGILDEARAMAQRAIGTTQP
jgi:hypothetical protein